MADTTYPTPWSEWERHPSTGRYSRTRLRNGSGDISAIEAEWRDACCARHPRIRKAPACMDIAGHDGVHISWRTHPSGRSAEWQWSATPTSEPRRG